MRELRLSPVWLPIAMIAAIAIAIVVGHSRVDADLDNQLFTSKPDRLSLVVPRGWRATDQASYPGVLLWMQRSQPPGEIALTAEQFTRELYCSWPLQCRASHDPLPNKYACSIRAQLAKSGMKLGPIQAGPRENIESGLPSVWFEYDDGKHFLRQALALSTDRAISLVLSSPTIDARASHVRAYEQALRTLHQAAPDLVTPIDATLSPDAAPVVLADGGVIDGNGAFPDGGVPTADAGAHDAGVAFTSAPTAPIEAPVGPCK
jgi:hypothetical protein